MEDGTGAYLIGSGPRSDPDITLSCFSHIFSRIGTPSPKIAYIGTASQDDGRFMAAIGSMLEASGAGSLELVPLASENADVAQAEALMESCDIIFISGGEPADGMRWLQRHDLVGFLQELFEQGKPFFGISAGAIMMGEHWFEPVDPDDASSIRLVDCLGLVPAVFDAHGEDTDWADMGKLLALMGSGAMGYGLAQDGMAYADRSGNLTDVVGTMPVFHYVDGVMSRD